jgi:arylsulfatase A-like enzyme
LAEAETAEETVRSTPRPPNIIVVMGDDHAQWAVGAYGLDALDTPNIDWLAERGVLFENAMSPAPVCSPARASFHTGKMPSQHGVHDFLAEQDEFDANWLSGETLLVIAPGCLANGTRPPTASRHSRVSTAG